MKNLNSLNKRMLTTGLDLNDVHDLHYRFFVGKDYEWWYRIMPDDIVVDLGASVGAFSCHALDNGASEVYMVEPNTQLLKTAIYNTSPYMLYGAEEDQHRPKINAVNACIGRSITRIDETHQPADLEFQRKVDLIKWDDFVSRFKLNHIDVLKVNIHGAEYDIFDESRLEYFQKNVRHMAIAFYLNTDERRDKFKRLAKTFLNRFHPEYAVNANDFMHQKVRTQNPQLREMIFDDGKVDQLAQNRPYIFVYITNW